MKTIKIFDNNKGKIIEISFLFLTASIPFWALLNNISMFLALLIAVLFSNFKIFWKYYWYNKVAILFLILYVLMAISMLYTDNLKYGLKVIERTSLFLILPIIFTSFKEYLSLNILKKALKVFLYSTFVACIICLIYSIFRTIEYGAINPYNSSNSNLFAYFNLTKPLNTHPIYFGVNIMICIIILLNELLKPLLKLNKKVLIVLFLFYFSFLPLINSFVLLISLFTILFLFFIKLLITNKNITFFRIVFFIILAIGPLYLSSYFLQEKFKGIHLIEDVTNNDFSGKNFTSLRARYAKTICSLHLIEEHFWTGVGIGDGNQELIKYYRANNFEHGAQRKFNSHNQFLTTTIYIGVTGLVILSSIFFFLIYNAIRDQNFLSYSFLLMMFLFFLTESVLERQKGIFIFLFFVSLLPLFKSIDSKIENRFYNE